MSADNATIANLRGGIVAHKSKPNPSSWVGIECSDLTDLLDALEAERAKVAERYFVGRDDSGHCYAVPVAKKAEWYAWLSIPEDDERSWYVPNYAKLFEGYFTFSNPETEHPTEGKRDE